MSNSFGSSPAHRKRRPIQALRPPSDVSTETHRARQVVAGGLGYGFRRAESLNEGMREVNEEDAGGWRNREEAGGQKNEPRRHQDTKRLTKEVGAGVPRNNPLRESLRVLRAFVVHLLPSGLPT